MKSKQAFFLAGALIVSSLEASAQDPLQLNPLSPWYKLEAESGWHFDLGLGVESEATYAGSKNTMSEADIFARALYRTDAGHRYFIGAGSLGLIYSINSDTQLIAAIEHEGERNADDEPILKDLDVVDSTVEGQLTLTRRFGNSTLFATLQPDLAGDANKGLVWFVGGSYDWLSQNNKWRFSTTFDLSGGDEEYMRTEFGITEAESNRTGYASYQPNSGLKSITVGLTSEYYISNKLSLLGSVGVEHYLSDASDSPLIKDLGDDTTPEASLLLRWRF